MFNLTRPRPCFENVSFGDLFKVVNKTDFTGIDIKLSEGGKSHISNFMQLPNYHPLYVRPLEKTLQAILDNMLMINRDSISFKVISWSDKDYAAIYAEYNLIIGSRLLAYVPKDSIPQN